MIWVYMYCYTATGANEHSSQQSKITFNSLHLRIAFSHKAVSLFPEGLPRFCIVFNYPQVKVDDQDEAKGPPGLVIVGNHRSTKEVRIESFKINTDFP